MASSDRLTRLRNIRDQLEKELENETLARLNITAAGNPPPTSYRAPDGRSVSWNEYVTTMTRAIKEMNDLILNAGGDEGGIPETVVRMWV